MGAARLPRAVPALAEQLVHARLYGGAARSERLPVAREVQGKSYLSAEQALLQSRADGP